MVDQKRYDNVAKNKRPVGRSTLIFWLVHIDNLPQIWIWYAKLETYSYKHN